MFISFSPNRAKLRKRFRSVQIYFAKIEKSLRGLVLQGFSAVRFPIALDPAADFFDSGDGAWG